MFIRFARTKSREKARRYRRERSRSVFFAKSLSTEEVAAELKISTRTVKFYVSSALAKSGARDRAALLLWFVQGGTAPAGDPASRIAACVARIDLELATISSTVRDRAGRAERELAAATSARDCVAELERAFEVLKASMIEGGPECVGPEIARAADFLPR